MFFSLAPSNRDVIFDSDLRRLVPLSLRAKDQPVLLAAGRSVVSSIRYRPGRVV